MENQQKLKLIEGTFLPAEAKEVLMNIYTAKITFHELKNFSSVERFGKDDEAARRKIESLRKEMERLELIVAEAAAANRKLVIHSEIFISQSEA